MTANRLGEYLRTVRLGQRLSLRAVEAATGGSVSNAYISQIENGKIKRPSMHVLQDIALALAVPFEEIMERAGLIQAPPQRRKNGTQVYSISDLTAEEESELRQYLAYIRWKRTSMLRESAA